MLLYVFELSALHVSSCVTRVRWRCGSDVEHPSGSPAWAKITSAGALRREHPQARENPRPHHRVSLGRTHRTRQDSQRCRILHKTSIGTHSDGHSSRCWYDTLDSLDSSAPAVGNSRSPLKWNQMGSEENGTPLCQDYFEATWTNVEDKDYPGPFRWSLRMST